MATYNTAFGSLPGYNEMLGTTNTTGGGQQQVYGQRAQQQRQGQAAPAPAQTFAQLQQRGMARPAPVQGPQAQPFAQYGGSQQAAQMRQRLQEQLAAFGNQPSRYDTQAFQQIRGAQAANLQAEYQGQQKALNEELARRGLSASSVGGGRMGDLAGQQARALASLDAQMLQQAAETQAADRAQLLQAGQGLAELAGSQDLAQFEANRVAQAATFENQLRAAQFGQQQYEQAGQEALQGAQAEEAAQQAARQFDLTATGQAAGLSMDLQRLLGQQELERAQLTGTLGGQQTLAGQQFGEQQRQFNIQQALQQQLGLGGLGIQQQEVALKAQQLQQEATQFGLSLNEQQAARMQQYGLSAQELGLRSQQIQQEAALQGRQMSIAEAQNLAQNSLEQQKITQQASQFGLTLSDNQMARLQQLGISQQELGLEATRVQNQAAQFGQTLSAQQIQNQAQNNLEQARINEAIASRQTGVSESALERQLRQALQTQQLTQEQAQFNIQQFGQAGVPTTGQQTLAALQQQLAQAGITGMFQDQLTQDALQNAYARAAQLQQATGKQYTVNPATGAITEGGTETLAAQLQKAQLTGTLGTQSTLEKLQQNLQQAQALSQITGKQYTVDPTTGNLTQGTLDTEARRQYDMDIMLRRALGLSETTGYVYDPATGQISEPKTETVQGQLSRYRMLMDLAGALSSIKGTNITIGDITAGGGSATGGAGGLGGAGGFGGAGGYGGAGGLGGAGYGGTGGSGFGGSANATGGTSTAGTTVAQPSLGSSATPLNISGIPSNLAIFTEGQQFNYNGQILTLRSGKLYDQYNREFVRTGE